MMQKILTRLFSLFLAPLLTLWVFHLLYTPQTLVSYKTMFWTNATIDAAALFFGLCIMGLGVAIAAAGGKVTVTKRKK